MRKILLIVMFSLTGSLAAGGDEMKSRASLVEKCIYALGKVGSVHVENGRLKPEWSKAHVNTVSIGNHATVTFSQAEESKSSEGRRLYDDPIIYCLIKDQSEVAHLMSPEKSDGALRMTDLITLDHEYEENAFDKIVEAVRKGADVYAYDTFFSISGRGIKKIGETKTQKLDSHDYQND